MHRRVTRILVSITVVFAGRAALAQSTIELRSSTPIDPGAAVTLAQVAVLTGPEAKALADAIIVPGRPGQSRAPSITLQDVRRALNEHGGVNWGRIALRGSSCTLAVPLPVPSPVQRAAALPPSVAVDPASVRRAVADRIARIVQAEPEALRLTFGPDDDEMLGLSTTGRTLEIRPTAASDKLPLALTLYDGDRIIAARTIRVGVLVRRTVVIAAAAKSRGEVIEQGDVTIDEQWVGPNLKAASPDAVVGAAAQGRIATGQIIGIGDVAAPMIVAKGDQVSVSCVSGTIVLTTKARAMGAGRVGDVVRFQGLEDKRTFFARMSGRGRAVIAAPQEPGEPIAMASETKP